jgi:hypothetical protein
LRVLRKPEKIAVPRQCPICAPVLVGHGLDRPGLLGTVRSGFDFFDLC